MAMGRSAMGSGGGKRSAGEGRGGESAGDRSKGWGSKSGGSSSKNSRSGAGGKEVAGLSTLLAASGVLHFLIPGPYDATIPRALPGKARTWTYVSGATELTVAAAIALPRTRRMGGLAAAAFFAAVFPANVQMAIDWRHAHPVKRAIAYGRLPLQIPLVMWARRVGETAGKPTTGTPRRSRHASAKR
jgi:uncharacterized membrane protein